jgi:isopentenyl diphosphate isomerase/L-lactate dehydrogenase-like FMN-dependent dehydrogenase
MSPSRRRFLSYIAASPLFSAHSEERVIAAPAEAINVFDFEPAARKALPPAHFAYLATGVDDDTTLHANREAFNRYKLRPRRLIDVTKADLRTEIFGESWQMPVFLAPVGNQKCFHEEGEMVVARAARTKNTQFAISTYTNNPLPNVMEALGRPAWFQLYTTNRWNVTENLVRQAEQAGCRVMMLTVDTAAGRHTETLERARRIDTRNCAACHGTKREDFFRHKPMFKDIDAVGLSNSSANITWEHVQRLKRLTPMKLVIKGITTAEDAELCVQNGVDGIVVSNHGGRAEESGRGTLESLPEIMQAAGNRVPVLIDGGFRRGADIFKALALGAKAVGIGRPYLWGMAAFGQPGVERVLDIVRIELELVMKQCGVRSIAEITPKHVMT